MMRVVALSFYALVVHSLQPERNANLQFPREPLMKQESLTYLGYPRTGIVNLDEPPEKRWVEIIKRYRDEIIPYFGEWQEILNKHTEIDQPIWAKTVFEKFKPEYQKELQSILDTLNSTQVTWTNLVLFQVMYEMGSPMACSEVIAANEDGIVLHGRNLDYRVISPTIEISFIKGGKPVMVAPTYLGGLGMHTGLKPNHWSFGQNTRGVSGDTTASALLAMQRDAVPFTTYIRELMEQDLTFNEVVQKLVEVPLGKDMYLNIAGAGPYEGAVIQRAADPRYIHVDRLSAANPKRWFLFQTNDDMQNAPHDSRRPAGTTSMLALTQHNLTPLKIVEVMTKPPVYVSSNVVFFAMAPRTGQFCSVLGPTVHNDDTSIDIKRCSMTGWDANLGSNA